MSKLYKIERDSIVEALDDIEKFLLTIERIQQDKPEINYYYDIKIIPLTEPRRWEVELTLEKNETEEN